MSFCLLASFLLICRYNTEEETRQTLVAIMLGKKADIVGGQMKQTCSLFPLLKQQDVRTDFGTDAVLIGTVQPSHNTSGHFFWTQKLDISDILTDS